LAIAITYRFGPSRNQPQWRWISPGSIFAVIVWIAASVLFSWHTSHFGNYNKTYGSRCRGRVHDLDLDIHDGDSRRRQDHAELEHQTEVDTTTGAPDPQGKRGARMADALRRSPEASSPLSKSNTRR
jgi:membrane protein